MKATGRMYFALAVAAVGVRGLAGVVLENEMATNVVTTAGAESALSTGIRADWHAAGIDISGGGTWTLPLGYLDTRHQLPVRVHEGRLKLSSAGSKEPATAPTDLLKFAKFWLDSTTNLATNETETGIAAWYDVREEKLANGSWSNGWHRMTAGATIKTNNVSITAKPPVLVAEPTEATRPMMYFNGPSRGSWMELYDRNGAAVSLDSIRHVFVVCNMQNAYGFVFGSQGNVLLHPSTASGSIDCYYNNAYASHPLTAQATFYLDGVCKNPDVTKVRQGLQLIELKGGDSAMSSFKYFFNDRGISDRFGGDYVGELLIYDKILPTDDRLRIERYLMDKWGIAATDGGVSVELASGAEVSTDGDAGSVAVSGGGTLVKTGANEMEIRADGNHPFDGRYLVEGGTLQAQIGEIDYAFAAGDTVTAPIDTFGTASITAANDAGLVARGEIGQVGGGIYRLGDLPTAVRKASFGADEVVIGDRGIVDSLVPTGNVYATVSDGSFEESGKDATSWGGSGTWGGWTFASSGAFAILNVTNQLYWRGAPYDPGWSGGAWFFGFNSTNAWSTYRVANFAAPAGDRVMLLKDAGWARTTVTVPVTGDYDLTWFEATRLGYDGGTVTLSLIDAQNVTNVFAGYLLYAPEGFRPRCHRFKRLKAGTYSFLIDLKSTDTYDRHAFFDDFRLRLVSNPDGGEGVVPVPNGNFEDGTTLYSKSTVMSRDNNVVRGWTLTQGTCGAAATSAVDLDIAAVTRQTAYCYPNAWSMDGWRMLHFRGPDGRATTAEFSLPAGSWQLRCKAARWGFSDQNGFAWNSHFGKPLDPTVGVKVTVNGTLNFEATSAALKYHELETVQFPNVVTVAAGDKLVLEVRQATANGVSGSKTTCAYLMADDFEFVPVSGSGELVKNGSFESDLTSWTATSFQSGTANKDPLGYSAARIGNYYDANYGYTACAGSKSLLLVQIGRVTQQLDFPAAGLYRLSFWTRARYYTTKDGQTSVYYAGNRVRVSWTDGSAATNEIYTTSSVNSTNFLRHAALFRVPAAGKYTLVVQGVNNGSDVITGSSGQTKLDANVFVDAVSVTKVDEARATPPAVSKDLDLTLGSQAKLRLDYDGQLTIDRLKLGGRRCSGVIDASHPSGLVSGPGSLFVTGRGLMVIVR